MAKQVGATVTVNSGKEDLEQAVARLTHGKGVDKSFECVGREAAFAGHYDAEAQRHGDHHRHL